MSAAPGAGAPEELPADLAAVLLDPDGNVLLASPAARRQLGQPLPPAAAEALRGIPGRGPGARVTVPGAHGLLHARTLTTPMSEPDPERVFTGPRARLVLLLPADRAGAGLPGVDVRDREHGRLAHAAAVDTGSSLDLADIARAFVDVLVPDFADLASVDLDESVLAGDEPAPMVGAVQPQFRRAAVAARPGREWPAAMLDVGDALPHFDESPMLAPLAEGIPVVATDMAMLRASLGLSGAVLDSMIPAEADSSMVATLLARGLVLGSITVWRAAPRAKFDERDATLLAEIASRAALSVDNARRYTREHRTAVALQRALLPRALNRTPAAHTAGTYLPAEGEAGVAGDWFDVIPLSSLRTAFVVGDVVGHGLMATAAMGRLRTAVQTLADLDLEPGELLSHVDDLVLSYWPEHDPDDPTAELAAQGATAQYAVYDPATGGFTIASAGHPPPLVVEPGAPPRFAKFSPGPPLGVGGMPFESVELDLPPGTLLAFYTDGLVEKRDADPGEGMAALARAVDTYRDLPLEDLGRAVVAELAPPRDDDIALLLARTGRLGPDAIAEWELPADLALVSRARELARDQLTAWGLDDLAYATELVVSELVTNAIRYAGGPVHLRMLRDEVLVCEVGDPSNTQPRLRRARETDEGGRGLFLVAQLTSRWGSRYRRNGKTIWTEQATTPAPPAESLSEADLLAAFDDL
ncbi:ATP-binding SpoIIE family protein phosphatase [Yinghuangia seranimata]|uniref:ATP-binding SpoIIE family protein phosphatase n=1 Tax=Yinghuangia seranimata TaxID=408067 RepID=UPI00248C2130|nr:ATP-binding SpoIIE family protein phosphatase [Yinghuangia seranimata]MDI2127588.1 serine/threonine-protein phosphatase [Yinghuangia seranimata]